MTDAAFVQDVTRARNHAVRRYAGRFIDYEHAIHLDHFRSATIRVNLCHLIVTDLRRKTFERAVKLLAAKPRSVAELRDRLLRGKNTNEEVVETVIARLREYGYLNDERFAFSYASYKVKQKPLGRRRLERDLKFKKIDSGVANEALEMVFAETPEEQLIDQAIAKRIRIRGKPKNRTEAKSLFEHLLRQGFEFELVSDKVRSLATDYTDED
jgi:regulatory protein